MTCFVKPLAEELREMPMAVIHRADKAYHDAVFAIARDIWEHREKRPILLLSGPSGSGKTTTAKTIERLLDSWGCETHTISMDDYFFPLTEQERLMGEQGGLDLESPARVDADFLTAQLDAIAHCEPVELPRYDFESATRVSSGEVLTRKPGELVICEGIHALNPSVIHLPAQSAARMYISVRTRIEAEGGALHPSKIRLMRRMLRDCRGRGRSPEGTVERYQSVQRGEDAFIMPYKHLADYEIDTFHPYEVSVYRTLLADELEQIQHPLLDDIRKVVPQLPALDPKLVPDNSLIQEFMGAHV